jgi:hypothetical protein
VPWKVAHHVEGKVVEHLAKLNTPLCHKLRATGEPIAGSPAPAFATGTLPPGSRKSANGAANTWEEQLITIEMLKREIDALKAEIETPRERRGFS